MIESTVNQLIAGGWVLAAGRLLFVLLIYAFLVYVIRLTVQELSQVAREMESDDGHPARAALIVEQDAGNGALRRGQRLRLPAHATIGRGAANAIVVHDPHVSAQHAALWIERGQWWLRDLESSNGTLLNGEPVRTVVAVRNGDVLQCGRVRFRFTSSQTVPIERASL